MDDRLLTGGVVVWALWCLSVVLWTVASLRYAVVRRPERSVQHEIETATQLTAGDFHHSRRGQRTVLSRFVVDALHIVECHGANPRRLDAEARRSAAEFSAYRSMFRSLVAASPLFGLLGTVDGMIDTFASLYRVGGLFGDEVTVAGGISRALVTTQIGLMIGVPGLVAMRLLDRQEAARRQEIYEARAVVGSRS